jgi:hypothetical protein
MGTRGAFPGGKRQGREVDNSTPSSAKVKNARCNFTFTFKLTMHNATTSIKHKIINEITSISYKKVCFVSQGPNKKKTKCLHCVRSDSDKVSTIQGKRKMRTHIHAPCYHQHRLCEVRWRKLRQATWQWLVSTSNPGLDQLPLRRSSCISEYSHRNLGIIP